MLYNASIKVENSEYERYIKLGGYRGPLATSCCEPRKKKEARKGATVTVDLDVRCGFCSCLLVK